ncbi:hypothetical protein CH53_3472 [Yersinia intermedia]|nr:hypothetical protein CH53_3472 [Yersinia intermedia]
MKINVTNDSTKYYILKSAEAYDEYLRCMQAYMGERFYHNLENNEYMDYVLKSIIENGKKDFSEFLKKHKYKGSLKNVYFDEVLVNLRQIHNIMSCHILNY